MKIFLEIRTPIKMSKVFETSDLFTNILDFLDYNSFIQHKLINKKHSKIVKEFEKFKSKQFLKLLPVNNESLEKFLIHIPKEIAVSELQLHQHQVLIDNQYGYFPYSTEIMIHLHLSYFLNGRYHEIKIFEDYADTKSGPGDVDLIFVCYGVPGFGEYRKEIIQTSNQNLQKWMGLKDIKEDQFMGFLKKVLTICEIDIEPIQREMEIWMKEEEVDLSEFQQNYFILSKSKIPKFVKSQNEFQDGKILPVQTKVMNYKKETFRWIQDWMEELPDYEKMDQEKTDMFDYISNYLFEDRKDLKEIKEIFFNNE